MDEEAEIIAHVAAGTLPEHISQTVLSGRQGTEALALRAAAISLHNSGQIDILASAHNLDPGRRAGYDFFLVQHVFVEIIPHLDAGVVPMMDAVRALVATAGNDLASGAPNGAFREWATVGDRAINILDVLDPTSKDDAGFAMLALQALAKTDLADALNRAIQYLESSDEALVPGVAMAIGSFDFRGNQADIDRALAAILDAVKAATDDHVVSQLTFGAIDIAHKHPGVTDAAVLEILDVAAASGGDQTLHRISQALCFHGEDLSPAVVARLIVMMGAVKGENKGTINQIDDAIASLARKGRVDEALVLVEQTIIGHPNRDIFDVLDGAAYQILQIDTGRLASLIVGWLMSEQYELGQAAFSLVRHLHGSPLILSFDFKAEGLLESEAEYLACKTIGFLFLAPITATSILLSIISGVSKPVASEIADLMFDPLLLNFSGELSDWLKAQLKNKGDSAKPQIKSVLDRLELYLEGLRAIGRVQELRPSERERLIEGHRQHESMRQAHKKAEKKSVLASLIPKSVLLYGTKAITYLNKPGGEKRRTVIEMQSISHSYETPRLNVLEPLDLDIKLRVYQSMRRP